MFQVITRRSCTVLLFTHIHPFTTRRPATTQRAWRFRSELEWLWEPRGAAAGATAVGVATTTSPSTTTIISTETRMSTVATAIPALAVAIVAEVEVVVGNIILNTAVELLTQTGLRRTNSVERLAVIPCPIASQMRANGSNSRAQATARPEGPVIGAHQTAPELQVAVATDQVRAAWIQTGVEVVIASEAEMYRLVPVVARRAGPLAVPRVAAAARAPAVREVPQV